MPSCYRAGSNRREKRVTAILRRKFRVLAAGAEATPHHRRMGATRRTRLQQGRWRAETVTHRLQAILRRRRGAMVTMTVAHVCRDSGAVVVAPRFSAEGVTVEATPAAVEGHLGLLKSTPRLRLRHEVSFLNVIGRL